VRVSEQKRFWPRGPKGPCPGLRTAVLLTLFLLLPWVGAAPGAWASQANEGETPTVLAPQAASTTASAAEDAPPAPATPPAQAASAAAFSDAVKKGNAQALEEFLSAHPDSPEAAEAGSGSRGSAKTRRTRGRGNGTTRRAIGSSFASTPSRSCATKSSSGSRTSRATGRARKRATGESRGREAPRRGLRRSREARHADRLSGLPGCYPGAPEAEEARRRMEAVQADDAAFAEAADPKRVCGVSGCAAHGPPRRRSAGEASGDEGRLCANGCPYPACCIRRGLFRSIQEGKHPGAGGLSECPS